MTQFPFPDCPTLVAEESYSNYDDTKRISTFGGDDDLWGIEAAVARQMVNATDFSFVFSVEPSEETSGDVTVHDVEISVFYDLDEAPPDDPEILPEPPRGLTDVVIGNGVAVAVGTDGRIFYSANLGETWTRVNPLTLEDLTAVTYGRGVFVAVGYAGTVLTSTDGADWTLYQHPTRADLTEVLIFESEYHTGVISGGVEGPIAVERRWRLMLGGNILHMLDFSEFLITGRFYYDYTDPVTGETYPVPKGQNIGRALQPGWDPVIAMTQSPYNTGRRYLYGNNNYTRVFNDQELLMVNPSGEVSHEVIKWNLFNNLYGQVRKPDGVLHDIAAGETSAIAVGDSGLMFRVQPDTSIIQDIYALGSLVRGPDVPGGTVYNYLSNEPTVQFEGTVTGGADYYGIEHDAGVFIAVGSNGAIEFSDDEGVTWTTVSSGTTSTLRAVAMGGGAYIAVGDDDTVVRGFLAGTGLEGEVSEAFTFDNDSETTPTVSGTVTEAFAALESTADDESAISKYGLVTESLWSLGNFRGNVSLQPTTTEVAELLDRPFLNDAVLAETVEFVGSVADFIKMTYNDSVSETLSLLDAIADFIANQYDESVAEIFSASDTPAFGWLEVLTDTVGVAADAYRKMEIAAERADTLEIDGDLVGKLILTETISETLDVDGARTINGVWQASNAEVIQFGVALALSGATGSEVYTGWAVNTRNFAVSAYKNFEFNSLCSLDGVVIGATDDGLYELTGDDDAGTDIAAHLRTGAMDFGVSQKKRIPEAWIGQRRDGKLVLKTITDEETERWYELRNPVDGLKEQRVKMAKGVKANYWEFELHNVDGADFELDYIELTPVVLSRRGH